MWREKSRKNVIRDVGHREWIVWVGANGLYTRIAQGGNILIWTVSVRIPWQWKVPCRATFWRASSAHRPLILTLGCPQRYSTKLTGGPGWLESLQISLALCKQSLLQLSGLLNSAYSQSSHRHCVMNGYGRVPIKLYLQKTGWICPMSHRLLTLDLIFTVNWI